MARQTFILTALPNGFDSGGRARLSALVTPRLWFDGPVPPGLDLSAFPDLVDWPDRYGGIAWSATIDGGAPVALDVETDWLKPELWQALFTADTRVEPYAFDDYRGIPVLSFPVTTILDLLADLYGRASSKYGAGADRPKLEDLAGDLDLMAVARPSFPEPEPDWVIPGTAAVPFPDAPPTVETPEAVPEQPQPDDNMPLKGCAPGCLALPLAILRWLLSLLGFKLKPWAQGGTAPVAPEPPSSQPVDTPSFSTEVSEPPPAPAPPPPKSFLPPPLSPAQQVRHEAFQALAAFLAPEAQGNFALPDAAELADRWDFHQAIAALGDYPVILRRLGLVVDLLLPAGIAPPAAGTIRVEADGPGWSAGTRFVSPRTHFRTAAGLFTAAPRPSDPEIVDGFLRVDDTARFTIVQNEVAGDAFKVANAATHALRFGQAEDRAFGMPDDGGLPALRSSGLAVARREAAAELEDQFRRSCAINRFVALQDGSPETDPAGEGPAAQPDPTDELFAEDLVRGYRVDVLDKKTGIWRSLCERIGRYDFLDAAGGPVIEDAADEGFVQLAVTEPTDPDAPRALRMTETLFTWSGWSLAAPRPGLAIMPDDSHEDPGNVAVTPFRIETRFVPRPGSLPRLRFGRRYRLRARVADLAGNSVTEPGRADFTDDGPAPTAEIIARRFEPVAPPILMMREAPVEGESLERLVVRTPAPGGLGTLTARHVAPPKTSQLMAELHGVLDDAGFDGSLSSYDLSARESKSVRDDAVQTRPALDGVPGTPAAVPAESDPWIQPADFVTVAYLPDPQAKGVVFTGLPAGLSADGTDRVAFAGSWPETKPFRLELKALAPGAPPVPPSFAAGSGVLTVALAPAQRATVRINCSLDTPDLETRGVWEWTERQAPANLAAVKSGILAGRHWAHLPWRELTLVHAVQMPLADPSVAPAADKTLGDSFVTLSGSAAADNASTGRLQLRASWTDWVDDPDAPGAPDPATVESAKHIGEIPVPEAPGPVALAGSDGKLLIHEFHDTRYHRVDYQPVAVTRFREYFPAATNTPETTTRAGPKTPVDILNSARPSPPAFLYAVPLFEWDSPPGTLGIATRTRRGGGLRLYLDRPWYSSGDGELLGVLFLDGAPFPGPEDPLTKIATVWAADPVLRAAEPPAAATVASFPAAIPTVVPASTTLSLPEQQTRVSVAGHEVHFDPQRKLWYCDVNIDCGEAYWPFVRLALARFQPKSVEDAHLSAVQLTRFIQLPPTRRAKVDVVEPLVSVRVEGPIHADSEAIRSFLETVTDSNGLNEVELILEEAVPGADPADPLSWQVLQTRLIVPKPLAPGTWQGVWEGAITLPAPLAAGHYRLAIREYEWLRTDDADPDDPRRDKRHYARRMVYSDVFAL